MNQARQVISIPFKIKRSPTDLLKALSKTVDIDYNGPHYSLLDDTVLTPTSQIDKKRNLLSKASGIKAARYMIEKYPQAFMKDDCVPHVSKFFPPKYFTEEELKYPSEDLIYSLISWGKFKEAFVNYHKCKDQNIPVSEECKMNLLDVLSIHNCNDFEMKQPLMEIWYTKNAYVRETEEVAETQSKLWKKNGEAELMFKELTEKSAQAYCSLIKGMIKHSDPSSANELYQEMKRNNLAPDLSTLNELISLIRLDRNNSNDIKIKLIMDKLLEMKTLGIKPDLKTFNNSLRVLSEFRIHQESIQFTLNILKEMELLNIKPSLATWSYVLNVFYPTRDYGPKTQIFSQVLDEVEKMSRIGLEWRDANDSNFFIVALEKCYNNPVTFKMIRRLHSILMTNNNIKFLNNDNIFTNYFETYLTSLLRYETQEVVMKEWRAITPHVMSRTNRLLRKMLDFAQDNACYDYVPELWTNFVESKQRRNINFSSGVIKTLLSLMAEYKQQDELMKQFGSIIEMISSSFSYIDEKKENSQMSDKATENVQQSFSFEFEWDSKMLENLFTIALNADKLKLAWSEFEKYSKYDDKVHGEINEKCISNLFEAFLIIDDTEKALKILNLAISQRMSSLLTNELLAKLNASKSLNNDQISLLSKMKSENKKTV